MGRIKVLLILLFLLIGSFIIYNIGIYDEFIINDNYVIRKYKYKNLMYFNNLIFIDDYIYSYQYNDNYIGLRVLKNINEEYTDVYYLIDCNDNNIYGYYDQEDKYLAVQGTFSKDVLSDWYYVNEY